MVAVSRKRESGDHSALTTHVALAGSFRGASVRDFVAPAKAAARSPRGYADRAGDPR